MPEAYRVGIGGIAIESSTFSPLRTTLDDFVVLRDEDLLARYPFIRSDEDRKSVV